MLRDFAVGSAHVSGSAKVTGIAIFVAALVAVVTFGYLQQRRRK